MLRRPIVRRNVLVLAVAIDAAWGEPPAGVHPVVWMGRVMDCLERSAPTGQTARLVTARFVYGALAASVVPLAWAGAGIALQRLLPWPLQALALKPTFAGRALLEATRDLEAPLRQGDIQAAQLKLRALVSRPTTELNAELVSAAAIESLAENYVDSWLAPLLAYAVGGLPLAYAYRAVNTADAMWGYRNPHYEHLGKAAARLDDVLNWLPARLAAVLIGIAAAPRTRDAIGSWQRDGTRTASPNAGQPMAAAAGALAVRLEKVGHYVLNADGRGPGVEDIGAARRLIVRAMLIVAAGVLLVCGVRQ